MLQKKEKLQFYTEAFLFKLYWYKVYVPNNNAAITKRISPWSTGTLGGFTGPAIADVLAIGLGGLFAAITLETLIKVTKNPKKIVFDIFIIFNLLKNSIVYY